MTDMKARIEKAAERAWDTGLDASTGDVGLILRAAFPELFADPPSHWIAPMVATEEMVADAAEHCSMSALSDEECLREGFGFMRTAYLNQKDSE